MLVVGCQAAVACAVAPLVCVAGDVPVAGGDHRLNGDGHALAQAKAAIRRAVIEHRRIFVHFAPNAVTGQVADDAIAVAFSHLLHRVTHVTQPLARDSLPCARKEALLRDVNQALRFRRNFANAHREGTVGLPAVQHQTAVDGQDLPFPQNLLFGGNAMHHRIVNRRADGCRIPLVMQKRRDGVVFADELLGVDIQRSGTHTGLNGLAQTAQHFVEKRARVTHFADLLRILQTDHDVLALHDGHDGREDRIHILIAVNDAQ